MHSITFLFSIGSAALAAAVARRPGARAFWWPEMTDGIPLHPSRHGAVADDLIGLLADGPVVVVTYSATFMMRVQVRIADGTLPADAVRGVDVNPVTGHETAFGFRASGQPEPPGFEHLTRDMLHEAGRLARRALGGRVTPPR